MSDEQIDEADFERVLEWIRDAEPLTHKIGAACEGHRARDVLLSGLLVALTAANKMGMGIDQLAKILGGLFVIGDEGRKAADAARTANAEGAN